MSDVCAAVQLYDMAVRGACGGSAPEFPSLRANRSSGQQAVLYRAGVLLGASTLALRDAVKAEAPAAKGMLLFYAPQVLDSEAPDLVRANMPVEWAVPAFDVLQLEDYDFVIAGDPGSSARAFDTVIARLGYPPDDQIGRAHV